jgi:hypothetical protein
MKLKKIYNNNRYKASINRNERIVEMLINAGIDLTIKYDVGETKVFFKKNNLF